ncbi:MAG: glycerophosphodiester phosphodiesterase family protein [Acidiferrobacterales bacterium]
MTRPQLVAHRGYPEHYPENTLIGIEAAIRAGARLIEVDIQFSADEVPVLFHDRTLQRVCGVKGTVHHMSYDQLRTLHPSEFERFGYRFAGVLIPSLVEFRELLQGYPGVTAFVELKSASISHFGPTVVLNRVLRELEPIASQVIIISFSFDVLLAARRQGVPTIGVILERWNQRKHAAIAEINPDYVICQVDLLPRWGKVNANNAKLMVYDLFDADRALALAKRGIEFVETFAIDEMLAQLDLLEGAK